MGVTTCTPIRASSNSAAPQPCLHLVLYLKEKKKKNFRLCGGCIVLLIFTSLKMITEGHLLTWLLATQLSSVIKCAYLTRLPLFLNRETPFSWFVRVPYMFCTYMFCQIIYCKYFLPPQWVYLKHTHTVILYKELLFTAT